MNLVRCQNGHFYDEERYQSCPHCEAEKTPKSDMTMPAGNMPVNDAITSPVTRPLGDGGETVAPSSLQAAVKAAGAPAKAGAAGDDEKTVSFYKKAMGSDPVVGWLVCTVGEHFGEDFRLKSGRNFIGRAASMDVSISRDGTVSREKHAIIVYEPRSHKFLVQPGESKELCYLNGEVILQTEEIKQYDVLAIGETELTFFPCCSDKFNWEKIRGE